MIGMDSMKQKSVYICNECGYQSASWMGKCPSCNTWGSLEETLTQEEKKSGTKKTVTSVRSAKKLSEITTKDEARTKTEIGELDRVLGGGIVKGSMVLVGGDPGIGKSTLLLQICHKLCDKKILYISGEESERQIKMRAERLGAISDNLYILSETDVESVINSIEVLLPEIVIIDSIQTMHHEAIASAAGSVPQVREATNAFMHIAKGQDITFFIVGHVTKDGSLAGPRVLEHMVDSVLYFEGDRQMSFRILRAVKNRFGSTNEIGVFEMAEEGLIEVENPSAMLLEGRSENNSGSSIICTMEGTRSVLAEVQALVTPTGFGNPRRMSSGIDLNRVFLLIAVLEKRAKMHLSASDVYINVAGGLRIMETAADLGICAAIATGQTDTCIPPDMVFIGEVGLSGEIRSVSQLLKRLTEAKKLGFKTAVVPKQSLKNTKTPDGMAVIGVSTLKEAIELIRKK
ncbi:MAG: DNA repair protein RadA [Clostridia bacterium]|nr:DNA repair protein RadA [Clostridia bacterium]